MKKMESGIVERIVERCLKYYDSPEESNNEDEEEKPVKVKYVDAEKQKKLNKRRKDKKKAKKGSLICIDDYNADHTVSSLIVDHDLVVTQILSHLSIIEHDSHFIKLHHTHSEARPGFFIVSAKRFNYRRDYESFLSADLNCDGRVANIHTKTQSKSIAYLTILGPLRGFICLVDNDIFAVQIHNVSTQEVTPWIKSTVFMNVEKQNAITKFYEEPECNFGFDPSTGKHKVIFMWYGGIFKDLPVCEVLTVGDHTWRIIDDVPPCEPSQNISAYADGSIYWFVEYSESIMAFDIGSEKFRVILIPKFTLLEYSQDICYGFVEMDGCLAVIRRRDHTVKMWKFHDYNKENGTSTITSEKNWTECVSDYHLMCLIICLFTFTQLLEKTR
ncbi:hypothetical protein MKX01_033413 [Papaver californicum]|nr:hypothetical protein MKX01_033413 [Papaver californicum]